jgi:predicted aminopeptidase
MPASYRSVVRAKVSTVVKVQRIVLLCAAVAALSGCAVPFYWQAIGGQLELLRKRTPIEELIEDPGVDPALRASLGTVTAIRQFAVEELGLPNNDSYTTYVSLDRSYVVWNVVAAEEFSVDPKRWCFPFAGCVAYRGFFDRAAAERFQSELVAQGLDTHSGGATAYSTLGYFADPVLSTMINGGEQYVASLLFHELAHQKLYVKDDSEFSEAFATVLEEFGTERWLRAKAPPEALARYHERQRRRADFGQLIATQQARLRLVYESAESPERKRAEKEQAFVALQADYAALKQRWGGSNDYDAWFAQPLNNATLAAVATYTRWVPALRARLEVVGLETFYAETAALAELDVEQRAARLSGWAQPPNASR